MHSLTYNLRVLATAASFAALSLPNAFAETEAGNTEGASTKPLTTIIENDASFQKTLDLVNKTVEEQTLNALKVAETAFTTYKSFKETFPTALRPDYEKQHADIVTLIKSLRASFLKLDYEKVQSETSKLSANATDFLNQVQSDLQSGKKLDENYANITKIKDAFGTNPQDVPAKTNEAFKAIESLKLEFLNKPVSNQALQSGLDIVKNAPTYDEKVGTTILTVLGTGISVIATGFGIAYIVPQLNSAYRSRQNRITSAKKEFTQLVQFYQDKIDTLSSNLSAISSVLKQNPQREGPSETDAFCPIETRYKLKALEELTDLILSEYKSAFKIANSKGVSGLKELKLKLEKYPLTQDQRQISLLKIGVRDPFLKCYEALNGVTSEVLAQYENEVKKAA